MALAKSTMKHLLLCCIQHFSNLFHLESFFVLPPFNIPMECSVTIGGGPSSQTLFPREETKGQKVETAMPEGLMVGSLALAWV